MLRSMTGFGRGIAENKFGVAKIEIKSLNHKFFEVVNRLPATLTIFEDNIREALQKKISRGRLTLFLTYDQKGKVEDAAYVNKKAARQYFKRITELKKTLGIKSDIRIEDIISMPGVIACRPQKDDAQKLWPLIHKALNIAANDLLASKTREGKRLKKNIQTIIHSVEASVGKIKKRVPLVIKDYKKRLLKSIRDLTGKKQIIDREKMEEEAAIFARNCDISEEIHRISSHIIGFRKVFTNNGEAGRRLDFIAQEMHREANTIGAKANDFPTSKEVIKIKSLIEKIREQVQNVE